MLGRMENARRKRTYIINIIIIIILYAYIRVYEHDGLIVGDS